MKALLQLIRLPNLFTAPADSLAGWALATHPNGHPAQAAMLACSSVLLYLGGIVLNDLMDLNEDRVERPNRPLPSGAVSKRTAWALVLVSLPAGMFLAMLAGSLEALLAAVFLAVLVVMYNAGLKRTWMGPPTMGLCRGVNVLLGSSASHSHDYGFPAAWALAVLIALYVTGITCISRSEAKGGGKVLPGFGLALQMVALLGLLALSRAVAGSGTTSERAPEFIGFVALVGLLAIALRVGRAGVRAVRLATPAALQAAVKAGVLSLAAIHAMVVVGLPELGVAAVLIGLAIVAPVAARRLYVT